MSTKPFRIEQPCGRKWSELAGDHRRRFCDDCGQHVHNLHALSPAEIVALRRAGGFCAAFVPDAQGVFAMPSSPGALTRAGAAVAASVIVSVLNGCGGGPSQGPAAVVAESSGASRPEDGHASGGEHGGASGGEKSGAASPSAARGAPAAEALTPEQAAAAAAAAEWNGLSCEELELLKLGYTQ